MASKIFCGSVFLGAILFLSACGVGKTPIPSSSALSTRIAIIQPSQTPTDNTGGTGRQAMPTGRQAQQDHCAGLIDTAHIKQEIAAEEYDRYGMMKSLAEAQKAGDTSQADALRAELDQSDHWLLQAQLCASQVGR